MRAFALFALVGAVAVTAIVLLLAAFTTALEATPGLVAASAGIGAALGLLNAYAAHLSRR